MALNILSPSLTSTADLFSSTAAKITAIIRTRNLPRGVAGYVFNVVESYTVSMTSKITDKPIPDQDSNQSNASADPNNKKIYTKPNVDTEPETITVKGLVAEITNTMPDLSEYGKYFEYAKALFKGQVKSETFNLNKDNGTQYITVIRHS
jgi:hypothetical protein